MYCYRDFDVFIVTLLTNNLADVFIVIWLMTNNLTDQIPPWRTGGRRVLPAPGGR